MHNPEFDGDYLEAVNAEAAERDDFEVPTTPDNFGNELACAVIGILLVGATVLWLLTLE